MWKFPAPLAGVVSSDGYVVLSYGTKAIILDPFGGKISEIKIDNQDYIIRDVGIVKSSFGYFVLFKKAPEFEELFGNKISIYILDSRNFTELVTISSDKFNYHGDGSYLAIWDSRKLYVIHEREGLVWTKRGYGEILGAFVKPILGEGTDTFAVVSSKYITLLSEEGEPIWKMKKPKFIDNVNGVTVNDTEEVGVAYTSPEGRSFISLFADGEEISRLEFPFGKVLDFEEEFALGEFGFARWYYPKFDDMPEKYLKDLKVEIPIPKAIEGKILTGHYLLLRTEKGYEVFYPYTQKVVWSNSKVLKVVGSGAFILALGSRAELLSLPEAVYGRVKVPIPPFKVVVSDYGKVAVVYKLLRGFLLNVFSANGEKILEKRYTGDFEGIKFCGDEHVVFFKKGFETFAEFNGRIIGARVMGSENILDCSVDGRVIAVLNEEIVNVIIDGELRWAREIKGVSKVFVSGDGETIYTRTGNKVIAFSKEGRRLFTHNIPWEAVGGIVIGSGVLFELSPSKGILVTEDGVKPIDLSILPVEVLESLTKYGFGFEYDRNALLVENKSRYKVYDLNTGKIYFVPEKGACVYGPVISPSGRYLAYINKDYEIEVIKVR